MAWNSDKRPGVRYITDNPYHKLVVDIDVQNLGVIIDQIVANAVQHTTQGMVRVRYDYTGEGLVLAFQDTGCGIPKHLLDHIFDRFNTSSSHGTGLGLAICHELVQQMGGRITIRSEKDRGTIVWVTIPCNSSEIERK
jgi:signal transduction histidine kinase